MSSWREQALIKAPIDEVWCLVGDPARYPEWAADVIETTGLAKVEEGATFKQESRVPLGKATTEFQIEDLEDLHEIRLRCLDSGYYSHWLLTEAGEDTFAEVELGLEPNSVRGHMVNVVFTKRWYRKVLTESLDGLRAALAATTARQR